MTLERHGTVADPDAPPALVWDVFCRVIDNFGDIGVCWRLAAQLGARGQRVRLWADDLAALRWMAPDGAPGVEALAWTAGTIFPAPGDVVVEAFGCDPPPAFVAAMAAAAAEGGRPPVWINLEYLSAEDYVERSHGLASPQLDGPGRGLVKWFFYPGYTRTTGGLLRDIEPDGADAASEGPDLAWRQAHGLQGRPGERLVSVFCYAGAPIDLLVSTLAAEGTPALLATAPGAATGATRAALAALALQGGPPPPIRQVAMPWLTQPGYDRLLRCADVNLVRGEDSWVRAQWAGRPFLWQAYFQDDGAHAAKLAAFLDRWLARATPDADAFLRHWTLRWNGLEAPGAALPPWTAATLAAAGQATRDWRDGLRAMPGLVARLLAFVLQKR